MIGEKEKTKITRSAVAACITWFLFHFLAFYLPQIIISTFGIERQIVHDFIDIPFIPQGFTLIYVLAYIQWFLNAYVLLRERDNKLLYKFFAIDAVGKIIAAIIFTAWPTQMIQPDTLNPALFDQKDFWIFHLNILYSLDDPVNLFPSIHCFESLVDAVVVCQAKKTSKAFKIGSVIFTLFVFASTVFTKQHILIDIPGGVLLFVIMYFTIPKTSIPDKLEKLFTKLDKKPNEKVSSSV